MNETDTTTEISDTKMGKSEDKMTSTEAKTVKPKADQDQVQTNYVGEVERRILAVQQNPETAALVAKRMFNAEKLTEGLGLVAAFQGELSERQQTLGQVRGASAALTTGLDEAKAAVTEFRESVRLAYPGDRALQQTLGVTERVPQDQEKFLLYARTCAATAKKAPYAQALTAAGFEITAYESKIDAFATARTDFLLAEQAAKSATVARDDAFKVLKTWAVSFHRALKLALKARLDLLKPLGL